MLPNHAPWHLAVHTAPPRAATPHRLCPGSALPPPGRTSPCCLAPAVGRVARDSWAPGGVPRGLGDELAHSRLAQSRAGRGEREGETKRRVRDRAEAGWEALGSVATASERPAPPHSCRLGPLWTESWAELPSCWFASTRAQPSLAPSQAHPATEVFPSLPRLPRAPADLPHGLPLRPLSVMLLSLLIATWGRPPPRAGATDISKVPWVLKPCVPGGVAPGGAPEGGTSGQLPPIHHSVTTLQGPSPFWARVRPGAPTPSHLALSSLPVASASPPWSNLVPGPPGLQLDKTSLTSPLTLGPLPQPSLIYPQDS